MADELTTGFLMGQNDSNNGGWGFGGEGLWAVIILAIIFGWGGNGFGFGGGGQSGADTRSAVADGFALDNLNSGIRGVQNGLCDGFYAMNTSLLNGFSGVNQNIMNGFNQSAIAGLQSQAQTQAGITALASQMASCCCDQRYDLATQSCQTRQAISDSTRDIIENQNANYRGIIDFLTTDKIQQLRDENQSLKFAASQASQNTYLTGFVNAEANRMINRIAPYPIPAYTVPAPYAYSGSPYGCDSCGC